MFRFFENLVDPYTPYVERDTPPRQLWPFLREYCVPFKGVFLLTGMMSIVVAAIEIGLIYYMGRIVDLLGTDPAQMWATYRTELMLMAGFVLVIRPLMQGLDVALINNTILPNFGTLIRWRAHRQVLRQSVGWFENDFAGRIANRIMQTPPAAGEVVFQTFDAISYALAYMIGAAILLMTSDWRLMMPLLIWFVLYGGLVRWTTTRIGPASKAASDARSQVTGRVVDAYTNIHSVKMFAHHDLEVDFAKEAIENARVTFQKEMRLFTIMDVVLVALNGLLIIGVVGWALALWTWGEASVGVVAAAAALTLRLNSMTGWIMCAVVILSRAWRGCRRNGDDCPTHRAGGQARCQAPDADRRADRAEGADPSLRSRQGWLARVGPDHQTGRTDRFGGAVGGREIHVGQAVVAVLRCRRRSDLD
jgi:ATP-binding cassette subfamily B multidrug efflux pump